MRFKTTGTFATEDIIEISQRVMAQCQEAGVDHVSCLNIYLTPTDAAGKHKRFVQDGLEKDHIDVETWDLHIPEPESEMTTVYADEPANQAKPGPGSRPQNNNGRRRNHRR